MDTPAYDPGSRRHRAPYQFIMVSHAAAPARSCTPIPCNGVVLGLGSQGCDHFTFFGCVDHVHVDAMIVGATLMEFHLMYAALAGGHALFRATAGGVVTTTSAADNTRSASTSRRSRPRPRLTKFRRRY